MHTSIQFGLFKYQTVTKNNNTPATIIYVTLHEQYKIYFKMQIMSIYRKNSSKNIIKNISRK